MALEIRERTKPDRNTKIIKHLKIFIFVINLPSAQCVKARYE